MELKNKVALVTGGGTGIGRATSFALAERGAIIIVNYSRSQSDADETVTRINGQGGRAIAVQADVSKDKEVRKMVENIVKQFGTVDLLVNNASITKHIPMDDLEAATGEVWDELFDVNVKGMFYCARAVASYMKKNKQGAIVNLGSIAGQTGLGSSLPYAVSKAAVNGLTKSLARALAPDIRVNSVVPGAVATRWWAGREEQMNRLAPNLLLKRISTPEDVAQLICAALEQEALTGQIITVDSGQTL
jgi:3-oxoacyl-[acyl-carrier protein] reductase